MATGLCSSERDRWANAAFSLFYWFIIHSLCVSCICMHANVHTLCYAHHAVIVRLTAQMCLFSQITRLLLWKVMNTFDLKNLHNFILCFISHTHSCTCCTVSYASLTVCCVQVENRKERRTDRKTDSSRYFTRFLRFLSFPLECLLAEPSQVIRAGDSG